VAQAAETRASPCRARGWIECESNHRPPPRLSVRRPRFWILSGIAGAVVAVMLINLSSGTSVVGRTIEHLYGISDQ
jgi:hypothetical protein